MRPRDVLAENLKKLMAAMPELSTFPQITKAGGGSNGTLDRIRRKTTATSVDNLAALAHAFGLEPWQLLVPTLDPRRPPRLAVDGESLKRARDAVRALTDEERLALFSAIAQPGLPDQEVEKRIPATKRTAPADAEAAYKRALSRPSPSKKPARKSA